ncbi:MAG: hypothetical protein ACRD2W_09510 [Acidimicrobiales bacterium]
MIQGTVDVSAVAKSRDRAVGGFYDQFEDRLYIRIADPTPLNQRIVVHELTHALDDQHFDLDRDHQDAEGGRAWRALAGGSASAVERRFYESRSSAEEAQLDAEERRYADRIGKVPRALAEDSYFAYDAGLSFVDALHAKGQNQAVDAAFRSPPETTEQILHVDRYEAREAAIVVAGTRADGQLIEGGTLGEAWFRLLLSGFVDDATAERAAAGWGGDHHVLWRDGTTICARAQLRMDTAEDAAHLASLRLGDEVAFRGPTGRPMVKAAADQDLVLIATGVGVAPFYSLSAALLRSGDKRRIELFWGLRSTDDLCLTAELDRLAAAHSRCRSPRSTGRGCEAGSPSRCPRSWPASTPASPASSWRGTAPWSRSWPSPCRSWASPGRRSTRSPTSTPATSPTPRSSPPSWTAWPVDRAAGLRGPNEMAACTRPGRTRYR